MSCLSSFLRDMTFVHIETGECYSANAVFCWWFVHCRFLGKQVQLICQISCLRFDFPVALWLCSSFCCSSTFLLCSGNYATLRHFFFSGVLGRPVVVHTFSRGYAALNMSPSNLSKWRSKQGRVTLEAPSIRKKPLNLTHSVKRGDSSCFCG